MFHQGQLFANHYVEGPSFFSQVLITLSVLYVTTLVQYFMLYSKIEGFLIALLLLLLIILLKDGSQLVALSLYNSATSISYSSLELT